MARVRRFRSLRRPLVLLPALLALSLAVSGCSVGSPGGGRDLLDRTRESGVLRVANTQANPPWNFLNESAQPVGYDIDVANELARRLGISKVEFVASNFQSFIEGVRADRFDMVISGQTITEERRRQVDFSRPYQVNGVAIFVRPGEGALSSLADLTGRRVGVTAGSTQEQFAQEEIADADVRTYQNATLSLTDLSRGSVDAVLVSRFLGTYLAEQNGIPVEATGKLLETEVNAMTFAPGSPQFKRAVDEAIAAMIEDGTLTEISKRWLGGLDMAAELQALPPEQNR